MKDAGGSARCNLAKPLLGERYNICTHTVRAASSLSLYKIVFEEVEEEARITSCGARSGAEKPRASCIRTHLLARRER